MNQRHPWSDADHRLIRKTAGRGESLAQAARALGVTKNMVTRRARKLGVTFRGANPGGCTSEQALRGWQTRRARQEHPRHG